MFLFLSMTHSEYVFTRFYNNALVLTINPFCFYILTLKIVWSMRRWRSVKTNLGFLFIGILLCSPCSFLLHAAIRNAAMRWNSGSWSHFFILRNVSRPDLSFDHGFGLRKRSESVPCDRHKTRCAKIACGIEYRFSSAVILAATSFVFTLIWCVKELLINIFSTLIPLQLGLMMTMMLLISVTLELDLDLMFYHCNCPNCHFGQN